MPVWAPRTAALRSASAKMMLGLLPPSSSVTRLFVSAAIRMIWRPTSVDPVNEILSTSGWRTSAAPAVEPPLSFSIKIALVFGALFLLIGNGFIMYKNYRTEWRQYQKQYLKMVA